MPLIQLFRRFDFTVFKNKSGTDDAQVPASASLSFYRQGATVKTTINLLPTEPPISRDITVDDVGQIAVGDTISIGFNGPQFEVTGLVGRTKVSIPYTGTSSLQVTAGTRLVAPSVQLYKDAVGSQPLNAPYSSDGTTGRFGAYVGASRFDFTVAGSGLPMRAYIDNEGGPTISVLGWLMARDFSSLDAAIAACPDGKETTIALEPITYHYSTTLVVPPSKRIRLLGAGRDLTTLTCTDKDQAAVWIKGSWCGLEALTVRGPGQVGTGAGIVIGRLTADQPTPPDILRYTTLREVHVENTPSWGVDILGMNTPGGDANSLSIFGRFFGLTIKSNLSNGCLRIQRGNTTQDFISSEFINFVARAAYLDTSDTCTFHQCTFEGQPGSNPEAFVEVKDSRTASFTSCWFEEDPSPVPPPDLEKGWFLHASGARTEGLTMTGCIFNRPTGYRTAAVLLNGCPGAVISGMTTSAPEAAGASQSRDDVVLRRKEKFANPPGPDDYFYPEVTLVGGVADAAGSHALSVTNETAGEVVESRLSGSARQFERRPGAMLPWLGIQARSYQYGLADPMPGTIFFNAQMNRLEYFDGAGWRFLLGTPFVPAP